MKLIEFMEELDDIKSYENIKKNIFDNKFGEEKQLYEEDSSKHILS